MTPIKIAVPGGAGTRAAWGEWMILSETSAEAVILDLSELRSADPLFLARMRAFIDWHSSLGCEVQVVCPQLAGIRNYLERMHLARDLPDRCTCDLGTIGPDDRSDVLIPIRRLASAADSDELEQELSDLYLAHFTGVLSVLAEAFTRTVGEISDNATTHGRSNVGMTYVAAQRYAHKRCVLAIGDLGVGIPEHMRGRHAIDDDGDAIRIATKEGISGVNDPMRGMGFQYVIDGLKDERISRGELRVWSGNGRFRVEAQSGLQERRRAWTVDEATVGTWVRLELVG